MILLLITITLLALSLFAAPYIVSGSELQVSLVKGALLGVNYDEQDFQEEGEEGTDFTLQVGLLFVLFTLTWTR